MTKLVTIYGGSGFVGRYIAQRMARRGWRVRVAVRRPNEATHVRPLGTVGQVQPVLCNIRDDVSVRAAMEGADAVVNCVGTFDRAGRNNFDAVQHQGAGRIARIAAELKVGRLVHISALGADAASDSDYLRTKAEGEAAVLAARRGAVILRPSVMFGTEDGFFNRFARLCKLGPILFLVGGDTRFQPVYVDDVAAAVEQAIVGPELRGVFELGGPQVKTLRGWTQEMLKEIERRRLVVNLPFWIGAVIAWTLDAASAIVLGLFANSLLTRDQVASLRIDNVVSARAKGLSDLGIEPTATAAVMPDYLWPYRPSGQFAAIRDSARNLKA